MPVAATLKSRIPELIVLLDVKVAAEAEAIAEATAEAARERVHVGTGDVHLRDHIQVIPSEEDDTTFSVQAGDEDVFYGHMVEYGTSHSAPAPFLIPAFEEVAAAKASKMTFDL